MSLLKKMSQELMTSDFVFHSTHPLKHGVCREVQVNIKHFAGDSFEAILTFFQKEEAKNVREILTLPMSTTFEVKITGNDPATRKNQGKRPFLLQVNIKDILDILALHELTEVHKIAEEILQMHLKGQGMSVVMDKTKQLDDDLLPIFRFTFKSNAILGGSFFADISASQIKPLLREVDLKEWALTASKKPPKRALH